MEASGGSAFPAGAPDAKRRDPPGGTGCKPAGTPDEDEPLKEGRMKGKNKCYALNMSFNIFILVFVLSDELYITDVGLGNSH